MAAIKRLRLVLVIMAVLLLEYDIITPLADPQIPVPMQCTNYTTLTEIIDYIGGYTMMKTIFPAPLSDGTLGKNVWYRSKCTFIDHFTSTGIVNTIACPNPQVVPAHMHPCRVYETRTSTVRFLMERKSTRHSLNITNCGSFYVYQLPQFLCRNKTEFFVGLKLNSVSCNASTTVMGPSSHSAPTTRKVGNKSNDGVLSLSELKKQVKELARKTNISDEARKDHAQKIIDQLSNLIDLDNMDEGQRGNGLEPQDLIDAFIILQTIVRLNISDCSLNILGPASNILDRRNTKSWRNRTDDKMINDLVLTLENYGFQCGEKLKNNPNATTIFLNHSNVQLHVKYVKQACNLSTEEGLFKFPDASFQLSSNALPQGCGVVVVVVWYKTINSFIRNSFYGDNVYAEVNSKIITASVRPEPRVKFLEPVRISWDKMELNDSATCVYWNPELNENKWKTDGCVRVKDKSDINRLICECDHLTAFAAMDISRDMVNKAERHALELISTIGCSVSLFGIVMTIITHAVLWKRLRQNATSKVPSKVLMHLCVAIGMTDILAILAGPAQSDEKFCVSVSILLYFFVLAVFGWMLCEGIIIYLQLVNVYTGLGLGGKHLKAFYVIGWGIPVIIVSVLVGLNDRENFITKHACWCRGGGVLFWTFVATTGLILLINLFIFVLALRSALSSSEVSTTRKQSAKGGSTAAIKARTGTALVKAKVGLKGSAILLPLLGLTWIFGLLVFNRDTIVFKYLFAVCNSLQGVVIFVFHILRNRKVHKAISREKKARKDRHITNDVNTKIPVSGTLYNGENSPRKSSKPVTLVCLKKNFNSQTLTVLVENSYTTENKDVISEDFEQRKL